MIIAERLLQLRGNSTVKVSIHAPEQQFPDWVCRFEINWPEGAVARSAGGVDSAQALFQAFQMIGAEICTSSYFEKQRIFWMDGYVGCGFPVPQNIRDVLIGDDAKFL